MNPILGTSFLSLFAKLKFSNYSLPFKADPEEGNEQRFNGLQQTKGWNIAVRNIKLHTSQLQAKSETMQL